jgi:hypothetical protein
MPMPDAPEKIYEMDRPRFCYTCQFYEFKSRPKGDLTQGLCYCAKHNKWFPQQGPELAVGDPDYLPAAGLRTCRLWR